MKHFPTIEKLDTGILYALELASSVSVLLLAFGLIASMANVLTKGSVLTDSAVMRQIWAWKQCVAIDASVAGTIIRTYHCFSEKSWAKFTLYVLLSCLLLFTAAIVSNIESVQQTLNITLDSAYTHVFVPVETEGGFRHEVDSTHRVFALAQYAWLALVVALPRRSACPCPSSQE